MHNIKLTVAYDGTDYKGWQIQKNGRTIQETITEAIQKAFGRKHRLYGAGRTDAGVHAKGQVAHFRTSLPVPVKKIPLILNTVLPPDIAVVSAEEVLSDFHSRFNAKSKSYQYCIFNSRKHDPFTERYAWRIPYKLDISLMKKEARVLKGKHDFKSFQASDNRERASVRKIFSIDIKKRKSFITVNIEGDGFLYNMVRNIAGTLVEIGRGYLPPGSMSKILKNRDRTTAGPTAPAKGLFLIKIKY